MFIFDNVLFSYLKTIKLIIKACPAKRFLFPYNISINNIFEKMYIFGLEKYIQILKNLRFLEHLFFTNN